MQMACGKYVSSQALFRKTLITKTDQFHEVESCNEYLGFHRNGEKGNFRIILGREWVM